MLASHTKTQCQSMIAQELVDMREKNQKLSLLESNESLLKYTVDMLNKCEIKIT